MPGFITHYLFGTQNNWDSLSSLKKLYLRHPHAYYLGLQGPDLFFYYLPAFIPHRKGNPGKLAHTGKSLRLFEAFFAIRAQFKDQESKDIADAYIMGAIAHYTLDKSCHPYIYARTSLPQDRKDYLAHHMFLEGDIDRSLLMQFTGRLPSSFSHADTVTLSRKERSVLSVLLSHAYRRTYPELRLADWQARFSFWWLQCGLRLLHDRTGRRKYIIRKLESLLLRRPLLSPMILSDTLQFYPDPCNRNHAAWRNPWRKSIRSTASFDDLMAEAYKAYQRHLRCFARLHEHPDDPGLLRAMLHSLGNYSYHSGLLYGTFQE